MKKVFKSYNELFACGIIEIFTSLGVKYFSLSPGSRSTPLLLAVAERKDILSTVHYDERGAAYAALGYSKSTGYPSVLISTSGSAPSNYYPAVIEAYMSGTPLIILSADRPPELQNVGANQTIDQENLYGKFVKKYVNLFPPKKNNSFKKIFKLIAQNYNTAVSSDAGPVYHPRSKSSYFKMLLTAVRAGVPATAGVGWSCSSKSTAAVLSLTIAESLVKRN